MVVEKTKLGYEGIFPLKDLVAAIKDWAKSNKYSYFEKLHQEILVPEGKHIEIKIESKKSFTDYATSIISIKLSGKEIKDKIVERAKKKVKLQEGKLELVFEGNLDMVWEKKWEIPEGKPPLIYLFVIFYILKRAFEKYIFSSEVEALKAKVKEDTLSLKNLIAAFLNLYKI